MSAQKQILSISGPLAKHWVGDGFPVRTLIAPNNVTPELSPFLMLDYAGPSYFEPSSRPRGVDEHPHRGFETVTLAYQGAVDHRDSAGNSGTIYPGDVQWMTAASGVVHEEKHEREFTRNGGIFEMVQLWINLPKEHKMSKPRYQGITSSQIPVVKLGESSEARVIAGELHGVRGPALTFSPVNLFDVRLKAGETVNLALPEGHNTLLVQLKGSVVINGVQALEGEAEKATLSDEGDTVMLEAKEDSTLLILTGEPIDEPVASYGPFVMNTREELMQAVTDYQSGRMGHLN
jgi:redox-sensitive bicupin YhaK (pirin superfamily)